METNKLKIYSDKKYLTQQEEYEPILFPFWGPSPTTKNNPFCNHFDEYIKNGKNYFEMSSIEDCDFVVVPEKYNKNILSKIQPLIDTAEKFNKPILIFFLEDSSEKIDIKNSYVFRTSFYKKTKNDNEFAMPSWVEDYTDKYFNGQLPILNKTDIPTVSYCGYTKTWKDNIKAMLGKDYGIWRSLRYQVVKILKKDKRIKTNFIIRTDFWGGAYGNNLIKKNALELQLKIRQEYVGNLSESIYALTTRGNGNFSTRFYEVLSLGKIPIFINTDCVLPYEKNIDWKKISVWVEDYELGKTADKIIEFNKNNNGENIKNIQREIYSIYKQWISPDGFFKNLYLHFKK